MRRRFVIIVLAILALLWLKSIPEHQAVWVNPYEWHMYEGGTGYQP